MVLMGFVLQYQNTIVWVCIKRNFFVSSLETEKSRRMALALSKPFICVTHGGRQEGKGE